MPELVKLSDGFNGSGIEDWLEKALQHAFNLDKVEVESDDMVQTAADVTKLTELNKKEITEARNWAAEHKAKPASNSFTAPLAEAAKTVITKRKITG